MFRFQKTGREEESSIKSSKMKYGVEGREPAVQWEALVECEAAVVWEEVVEWEAPGVRLRVPVIRTINGGRVTYSQLQSYNDVADVNQNYICTVLVVNNMKNGLYISVEVIKQ